MNIIDVIHQKRDGKELDSSQIQWVIESYCQDKIPDYQMSALGMAIFLNGMSNQETIYLTESMLHSGIILQWSTGSPVVDKHSTGGIGDKTSLILAPLLACCGFRVPMISGRGLGPTGGTLDKLEAISGFRTDLNEHEMQHIVETVGCVITGATPRIAPADRKLYALRDVTGIVASVPLITASILSKKLAENIDSLVLDVKYGSGSFMQSTDKARTLAHSLCSVGKHFGLNTAALITNMDQPLGQMIGNAAEVIESFDVLKGTGPRDVRELTLSLGAELVVAADRSRTFDEAQKQLASYLDDGSAYERFQRMILAQGGTLPLPKETLSSRELLIPHAGWIKHINCHHFGQAITALGGGRSKIGDTIDHAVGIEMLVRIGDYVENNQPWCRVLYRSKETLLKAQHLLTNTILLDCQRPPTANPTPLIFERINTGSEKES